MRISDWSSDVCSSDLDHRYLFAGAGTGRVLLRASVRADGPGAVGAEPRQARRGTRRRAGRDPGAGAGRPRRHPRQAPHHRLPAPRSEEHTSELQSLMRISYAVFCLKKKNTELQIIQQRSHAITIKNTTYAVYKRTHNNATNIHSTHYINATIYPQTHNLNIS